MTSKDEYKKSITWMIGYYLVQLWTIDNYPINDDVKQNLREYNQNMVDKYEQYLKKLELKNSFEKTK